MKDQEYPNRRQIELSEIEGEVSLLADNVLIALRLAFREAMNMPRSEPNPYGGVDPADRIEYLSAKAIGDMEELIAQLRTAAEIKRGDR